MRFTTSLVALCALSQLAVAQADASGTSPVNTLCPVGKEPVSATAGTVTHDGMSVGLCCPGCGPQFLAWDETRKDSFIVLASNQMTSETGEADSGEQSSAGGSPGPTYPYTLDSCPVGGKLGSMGEPVVKVYDNREVRFCCGGCTSEFEANSDEYWAKIDEATIKQQLVHYPVETCIVTGEKLGDDTVNHVHNNRLVRLGGEAALAEFSANPAKYLEQLDKSIVDSQLADYPMENCPVGGPLGSMGQPVNYIYMNRLVRFCCGGCESKLVSQPSKYMGKLDNAYAENQRESYSLDICVVSGAKLGSMGDPFEVVAGTQLVRLCCEACMPRLEANPAEFLTKLPKE